MRTPRSFTLRSWSGLICSSSCSRHAFAGWPSVALTAKSVDDQTEARCRLRVFTLVNENEDTLKLLKRWVVKEKRRLAEATQEKQAREAEAAKADAVFGKVGKKKDEL